MRYAAALQNLPQELRLPMLGLIEAVEDNMRAQLAVRREDFDALRTTVEELATAQRRTEQRVEELAEAQRRTEERVGRLEIALAELAEAQRRTEQRVEQLAEAQRRTEQRVEELAEAQRRTEETLQALIIRQDRMERKLDELIGEQLERRYREHAHSYFGGLLRRARVVPFQEIEEWLEAALSEAEVDDLRSLDLLIRGLAKLVPSQPKTWLAVEISSKIDRGDVERAQRRAQLLRKAGCLAIPLVAGKEITDGGLKAVQEAAAVLMKDGTVQFWEEAFRAALASSSSSEQA